MTRDELKILPQYLVPQHLLTMLMGKLADSTFAPWKNLFIKVFMKLYQIDMQLAQQPDYTQYPSFNDFFIRKLKTEYRPIDTTATGLASPIDGGVSYLCNIEANHIYNVKRQAFALSQLLGNDTELAASYSQGSYLSLYLAPQDYHRIHMPLAGRLCKMTYIPGRLFSVSNATLTAIPDVFAKNERLILHFDTDFGPMLMILVGAMIVASLNTVWQGEIARENNIRHWHYPIAGKDSVSLAKGDELGHFKLGSTVILLFPDQHKIQFNPELQHDSHLIYGQKIAEFVS